MSPDSATPCGQALKHKNLWVPNLLILPQKSRQELEASGHTGHSQEQRNECTPTYREKDITQFEIPTEETTVLPTFSLGLPKSVNTIATTPHRCTHWPPSSGLSIESFFLGDPKLCQVDRINHDTW